MLGEYSPVSMFLLTGIAHEFLAICAERYSRNFVGGLTNRAMANSLFKFVDDALKSQIGA